MDRNSNLLWLSVFGKNGLGKTPFLAYCVQCNMFYEKNRYRTSGRNVFYEYGASSLTMNQDSRCFSLLGLTHICQFPLFISENNKIYLVFLSSPFSIFTWTNYNQFLFTATCFIKAFFIQSCMNSIQPLISEMWDCNTLKRINTEIR